MMKRTWVMLLLLATVMLAAGACAEGDLPASVLPTEGSGAVTVRVYGAYAEYTGGTRKGRFSALSFDTPAEIRVTAVLPKGKSVDYWVIDGVRYDFRPNVPTALTLNNVSQSMTVEAVANGRASETLLTAEALRQANSGGRLTVSAVHAKFCHVLRNMNGGGGWMNSFDFTKDYRNKATGKTEAGGQISIRLKSITPRGKKVGYWKFDDAAITFDQYVAEMLVRGLNVSKTYEPVFADTFPERKAASPAPKQPGLCRIVCSGCTFTGGGYTNAVTGDVVPGTYITVRSDGGETVRWRINGTTLRKRVGQSGSDAHYAVVTDDTIQRTVYSDLTIQCGESAQ